MKMKLWVYANSVLLEIWVQEPARVFPGMRRQRKGPFSACRVKGGPTHDCEKGKRGCFKHV